MGDSRDMIYAKELAALIKVQTISVEEGQDPAEFAPFHQLLRRTFPKLFAAVSVEEFDGSLLLRWKGKSGDKQPVLFMSHHDVVSASGQWRYPPFSGEIAHGKLWGRGTLDTKGSLWAMLRAAEELIGEGFVPKTDIYFASSCNEETTGDGADTISTVLGQRGIQFSMVLDEGGMILEDPIGGVKGIFAMVGVGEKGIVDLKFTARSNGGHASMPGKNTPLVRLGKFMGDAERTDLFTAKLSPVVQEMFTRMAPYAKGALKPLLGNAGKFRPLLCKVLPEISDAAGAMVKTTIAFTMCQGSEGRNVLPQEAWVIGNMRYSHHQGRKSSIEAIQKLAKKYDIETEVLDTGFELSVADYKAAPFQIVEQAVNAIFPGVVPVPYIMTGASDSRFYERVCDHCIRFAPFLISDAQLDSIHGIDENIDICALPPAVDFYKFIMGEI